MTYTTDKKAAIDAMSTPAERTLAIEIVDERIRSYKTFRELTEKAAIWEGTRVPVNSFREKQPNAIN